MSYGFDDRISISFRVKKKIPSIASRPSLGPTQPPIQRELGTPSPAAKRQVSKADDTPPSSAEVKNDEAIPPHPIYLHGVVLNYITIYKDT
jgi:hypothetical protein